ncbi:SCP-like protein [Ancylostoma ceylanicum]|uniref:SCP-like protein n=1 Tax=Ancylostoma ceylanicum TaxID=53326 RepID=A0A0D6LVI4_9BILA|nr:SCP-like protein [Ancylostoma ceylanicum]
MIVRILTFVAVVSLPKYAEFTQSFGCKNSLISDEWREMVLIYHNDSRSRLAMGEQQGSAGKLPAATDMNSLNWDCTIEELAEAAAKDCPIPAKPPANYGAAAAKQKGGKKCNATSLTRTMMRNWWNQGAKKQADQQSVADNGEFSQMALAATTGFACTYQVCSNELYLLCLYNKIAPAQAGQDLYAAGTLCDTCQDTCTKGLCHPTYTPEPPHKQDRIYTPPAHYVTPAKTPVLKDSAILHTLLQRSQAPCVRLVLPVITFDITYALTSYGNVSLYRRLLATGWAQDKKIKYAPQAKNMMELAIEEWWKPLSETGVGENNEFTDEMNNNGLVKFANIAYDRSTKVGCAVKRCQDKGYTVVDCQYQTPISVGDKIYEKGKPCKSCSQKCSPLGGLCQNP